MPWNDKKVLEDFKVFCDTGCNPTNGQDNYGIYIVKASGCGKTKLALSLGLETEHFVVPIRLYVNGDSKPVLLFPLVKLINSATNVGNYL